MTTDLDLSLVPTAPASLSAAVIVQDPPAPDGGASPDGSPPPQSPFGNIMFPLLLIGAIFYFVLIAPERKARRKREAMLADLKKGDKVMTTGGMFAVVAALQDDVVTLQIDEGVRVRYSRSAIQTVLDAEGAAPRDTPPKGTPAKGRR